MSAPAAAAASNKRARPDPVSLLWEKLGLLVKDIQSDLKPYGPLFTHAHAVMRRTALPGLRAVVETEGWATTAAINAAVVKLEEAVVWDTGNGWCEEAKARLGTIRLLLDSQNEAQKKAKPTPVQDVVHLIHIRLDGTLVDEIWVVPVSDAAALRSATRTLCDKGDREAGSLLPAFDRARTTILSLADGFDARENERVLWMMPIYHAEGVGCAKCMLCEE